MFSGHLHLSLGQVLKVRERTEITHNTSGAREEVSHRRACDPDRRFLL